MEKNALISVFDKKNLVSICKIFKKYNINIISTGNTAAYINNKGYKCKPLQKLIRFKEVLGGRVKSLHPYLHASILFDRNKKEHLNDFKKFNFPKIDYVIVNLYPFAKSRPTKDTSLYVLATPTNSNISLSDMPDITQSLFLRSAKCHGIPSVL